ncbi:DUF3839 domain-containing protein [Vibrio harveyi]|uniref:DUF3839 domain-containing protein n=1 Tax=Vibrio harveyi group TaxID=717610 RepID=UPI0006805453|nr:DUF3839 domain-containing protein [Vibrio campbellii]
MTQYARHDDIVEIRELTKQVTDGDKNAGSLVKQRLMSNSALLSHFINEVETLTKDSAKFDSEIAAILNEQIKLLHLLNASAKTESDKQHLFQMQNKFVDMLAKHVEQNKTHNTLRTVSNVLGTVAAIGLTVYTVKNKLSG